MDSPSHVVTLPLAIALSYLGGSIPWGLVLVRFVRGVDVRTIGSGNIGATNAMRAGGKALGLVVYFLDLAKGWIGVSAGAFLAPGLAWAPVAGGGAALIGHCFPVWLRFKGGKGVATLCGVVLTLDPAAFLAGGLVWIAVLAVSRYVGLASVLMSAGFAVAHGWRHGGADVETTVGLAALAVLIAVRHGSNMARMFAGTEPRVFQRSEGGSAGRG